MRSLGMFVIFLFAAASIFGSIIVRDIDNSTFFGKFLDSLLEYTIAFENRFYDFRMRTQLDPNYKVPEIVLVNIDDISLQKLGTWPIPRTEHAKMIDKLSHFGAKVIALDVLYPEKSPGEGKDSPDTIFANSIRNFQDKGGRVFLAYTLASTETEAMAEAPLEMLNDAILTRNVPNSDIVFQKINKFTFPIQELLDTEVGLGIISISEDRDGIFRHTQLVANIDPIYYGSLG